jgi:hypothetical protein
MGNQQWIRKAIDADESKGMRFPLGRDYALLLISSVVMETGWGTRRISVATEIFKECSAGG